MGGNDPRATEACASGFWAAWPAQNRGRSRPRVTPRAARSGSRGFVKPFDVPMRSRADASENAAENDAETASRGTVAAQRAAQRCYSDGRKAAKEVIVMLQKVASKMCRDDGREPRSRREDSPSTAASPLPSSARTALRILAPENSSRSSRSGSVWRGQSWPAAAFHTAPRFEMLQESLRVRTSTPEPVHALWPSARKALKRVARPL